MKYPLLLLTALSIIFSTTSQAKDAQLSNPLDLPSYGWYKVLQVSNGNTMLFIFEARKAIEVKIFNPDKKEIASTRSLGKLISMNAIERSDLHGIYEINNEGVIFISQDIVTLPTLVAMRFDTETGELIAEEKLIESESYRKRNEYNVVRMQAAQGYAVFCMKNLEANFKEEIFLQKFDEQHNVTATIPIDDNRSEYDYVKHVSTCTGPEGGIMITLNCRKIIHYPDVINNKLLICYLPPDAKKFSMALAETPEKFIPYYSMYSYNDFGKKLNVLLINAVKGKFEAGLRKYDKIFYNNQFLMLDANDINNHTNSYIIHHKANDYLQENTDTNSSIDPVPIRMYTNKFGLNTVISEENKRDIILDKVNTNGTLLGNIVVTQVNDRGAETWATIIPKTQILINTLYTSYELNKRGTLKLPFRRNNLFEDWIFQFASFNSFMNSNGDCYVIYNDLQDNFDRTIQDNLDTMTTYTYKEHLQNCNIVCYKIGRRKTVEKSLLLKDKYADLNYSAVIESSDFDERTNTFASLITVSKDRKYQFRMLWKNLDED